MVQRVYDQILAVDKDARGSVVIGNYRFFFTIMCESKIKEWQMKIAKLLIDSNFMEEK